MIVVEIRSDAQVVQEQFIHATRIIIGETAIVEGDAAADHRITLAAVDKE